MTRNQLRMVVCFFRLCVFSGGGYHHANIPLLQMTGNYNGTSYKFWSGGWFLGEHPISSYYECKSEQADNNNSRLLAKMFPF